MHKFYILEEMTQEDLNNLALERNTLKQENEKLNHYKLLYQKVKERNDKCINYIKYEAIIDNEYYRHEILDILKGNNE